MHNLAYNVLPSTCVLNKSNAFEFNTLNEFNSWFETQPIDRKYKTYRREVENKSKKNLKRYSPREYERWEKNKWDGTDMNNDGICEIGECELFFDYGLDGLPDIYENYIVDKSFNVNISSTKIREAINQKEGNTITKYLHIDVLNYISKNNLYVI